jgi:hypothetical protein
MPSPAALGEGALLWSLIGPLPVGFSTVSDGYHFHHLRRIVHNVKEATVSRPQADCIAHVRLFC